MTYRVLDRFDPRIPSWPGNGTRFGCIFGHSTEGGVGVAGAEGTITFLINTPERGASYHEIWAFEEGSGDFTVLGIVPPDRAAGSVDPHPPIYNPDAYARSMLGVNADDPNQGGYAVSVAGRVADVDRWASDPRFLAGCKQRLSELQLGVGPELGRIVEHFRLQPSNRTDWGRRLTPALTGQSIPDTAVPQPEADEVKLADATMISPRVVKLRDGAKLLTDNRPDAPLHYPDPLPGFEVELFAGFPGSYWLVRRVGGGGALFIVANSDIDHNIPFKPYSLGSTTTDCTPLVEAAKTAGFVDAKTKARLQAERHLEAVKAL